MKNILNRVFITYGSNSFMKALTAKDMALASLFASLTGVGAFVKVPFYPVPMTLQSLFVLLSGAILGSRLGPLSQAVYVIVGLAGVPIFAGGGGPSYILQPSFGYLAGFILGAYIVGILIRSKILGIYLKTSLSLIGGTAAIYLVGVPYLYVILNYVIGKTMSFRDVLKIGMVIFLPGDLAKVLATLFIIKGISGRVNLPSLRA